MDNSRCRGPGRHRGNKGLIAPLLNMAERSRQRRTKTVRRRFQRDEKCSWLDRVVPYLQGKNILAKALAWGMSR